MEREPRRCHLQRTAGGGNKAYDGASEKAQLLAVAVLRKRPILLVDQPHVLSADYLRQQARDGHIVIVSSDDEEILRKSDNVIDV